VIGFDADVQSGVPRQTATPPLPRGPGQRRSRSRTRSYDPYAFFRYDLGVVVLDTPIVMPQYGALPQQDVLDSLSKRRGLQETGFTAVGYGMQASFPDAASWKDQSFKIRMVSYPQLVQNHVPGFTGDFSMLLSNNATPAARASATRAGRTSSAART